MAQFEIRALREPGGVVSLVCEAADAESAARQMTAQGLAVLAVKPRASWSGLTRRQRFPLVLFSQELLALLEAGLALVEALETLTEKEQRAETRKLLNQLLQALYEGQTLSAALQQFPDAFPPLYVASIRASEQTGDLPEALSRYVAYQAQLDVVRKKLVSASIYPLLLIGAGGLVTLFLLVYVVPKFSHIYEDMSGDLPLMSRLLMAWGQLLEAHGGTVFLGLGLSLAGLGYGLTRSAARAWIGQQLWQIPAVGERMRIYQLARFYRTLGMLLRGGIPVVTGLDMAAGLLHPTLRAHLQSAGQRIREGQSLSQAMEAHQLTTPVAQRMLRVGERTGQMGEMMERIAAFYDEEMARWVDWFTKLFEPLLMAVIGVVIGTVVVLMYLPIFELAGSIQ
ncbi:MAG: type II secretion system F family protein [Pseudomonadota bacterium]